ncbi:MAG: allantoate amidohydrolase [Proteobacteria bacterium]|nr:allantoate amidohydrolase [Pseudomonadota bacterium]
MSATASVDADRILDHIEALARCSERSDALTRVFLSPEARAAADLTMGWMREAGMSARMDAIGNVVGRYEGTTPGAPCLMLGSHLDTVRNAGRYDGMLGVVAAIDCVRALHAAGRRLPFAVEVVGFGDEEGVRFGATLLGSRAVAGTFDMAVMEKNDRDGISMRDALGRFGLDPQNIPAAARKRGDMLAYVELHIEQGPVLEAEGLPVGVVTAINGFTRLAVTVCGFAGHAGTVPMRLRADALAGAAECVLAVERIARDGTESVGTVGRLEVAPGAINVIPGEARFTVDLRAPRDADRERAVVETKAAFAEIAARRGLSLAIETLQESPVAPCAMWLQDQIGAAVAAEGYRVRHLPSGAGHDGMAIVAIADIGMIFVRCEKGISHNPAEAITRADVEAGARVLLRFVENFRPQASAA